MGFLGLFLSFAFAACGALRLARFNVLAARGDKGSSRFFVGLPIPLAAGALVSVVIAHYRQFRPATEPSTQRARRGGGGAPLLPHGLDGPLPDLQGRPPLRRRASPSSGFAVRRRPGRRHRHPGLLRAGGLHGRLHRSSGSSSRSSSGTPSRGRPAARPRCRAELEADEALEPTTTTTTSRRRTRGTSTSSVCPPRHGWLALKKGRPDGRPTPWVILAAWGPCGFSPVAPGTVGTLGAIPLFWALRQLPLCGLPGRPRWPSSSSAVAGRHPRRRLLEGGRRLAHRHRRGGGLPRHHGLLPLVLGDGHRRLPALPALRRHEALAGLGPRPGEERARRGARRRGGRGLRRARAGLPPARPHASCSAAPAGFTGGAWS